MKFEEKLIMLRKSKGMSQEELAEKLQISRQAISRWESGTTLPDVPNLIQLSNLFGVTTDYLVKEEMEEDTKQDAKMTGNPSAGINGYNLRMARYYWRMTCVAGGVCVCSGLGYFLFESVVLAGMCVGTGLIGMLNFVLHVIMLKR